jgi:hypothetical protein
LFDPDFGLRFGARRDAVFLEGCTENRGGNFFGLLNFGADGFAAFRIAVVIFRPSQSTTVPSRLRIRWIMRTPFRHGKDKSGSRGKARPRANAMLRGGACMKAGLLA